MPLFFMGSISVFVDHDVDTMLMSPEAIEAAITKRTGAIIATHLYGFICDMDTIQRIARAHGIPVIGDASQAHAGKYHGSLSAPFGDIGAVSTMAWKTSLPVARVASWRRIARISTGGKALR